MEHDNKYYDEKWKAVIRQMPQGGDYRFDLRQEGYNIVKDAIPNGSKVFDYACGLGVIDIQLAKEKDCIMAGCDWSKVATDYITSQIKGDFRNTDKFFGTWYDAVIAIYFLEHITNPVSWLNEAMKVTNTVICALPNNFRKTGEHVEMAWGSWQEFNSLFKDFNIEHIHTNKYSQKLHQAFRHPIIKFTAKEPKNARIDDTETTEPREENSEESNAGTENDNRKRRGRRAKA